MQQENKSFKIKSFESGPMENLIYLIWDKKTKDAAIIDPAWDLSEIEIFIKNNQLKLKKILLTHSHHDHINAIDKILKLYDIPIYLNKKEMLFWGKSYDNFQINYPDDIIKLGETEIKSMHTPGHTPGSVCYLIKDTLIAGDTLFVFGCGRCDLDGGNPEEMFNTINTMQSMLALKTKILPGHNYSTKKISTLEEQIEGNPFFHFNDLNKFVEYRMKIHDKIRNTPYSHQTKTNSH